MTAPTDPPAKIEGVTPPPPADPPVDLKKPAETKPDDSADKRIAELNEENKKHRLKAKTLEEENSKYKKAMEIINGNGATPDPVEMEKKKADGRVRDAFLKAAFTSVAAKEMHDAEFAYDALKSDFADVTVDLDSGKVDKEAIKTKLVQIKKDRSFLFSMPPTQGGNPPPPPNNPDGNGKPAGGNPYLKWQELSKGGMQGEALKFYSENKAAILAHWPK